jgi:hypothetical protein
MNALSHEQHESAAVSWLVNHNKLYIILICEWHGDMRQCGLIHAVVSVI